MQKSEPRSCTRLRNMVKTYVEQKAKDPGEMREPRAELRSDEKVMEEVKKRRQKTHRIVIKLNNNAPKEFISTCNTEVFENHVCDFSSLKNRQVFGAFCSSKQTFFLGIRVRSDLHQSRRDFGVQQPRSSRNDSQS